MKTNKLFWVFAIIIAVSNFSCKKTVQEANTIDAPAVKTAFVVQIFDATTQELIGMKSGKEIKVTILGTDKGLVKDIFGRSVSSLSTHQGIIALSISNSVIPSPDDPVDFVLDFKSNGYLHGSLPIRIASIGGHSFIARLVDPANPPAGISVFKGIVGRTSADGTLENIIDASTPPVQQTLATTHVVIPSGTKILDEAGTPLSGDLSFQIVYYSNQSPIALDCFPGSLCVKTDEDGIQNHGLFFSGGWADYELTDASDKVAKSFSNPISLTIDVPPNTYNPETKAKIQTGDFYPIWNYRYTDGIWEFENEGLLKGPSGNGNYYVQYDASHFSKKNADKKQPLKYGTIPYYDSVAKSQGMKNGNEYLIIKSSNKSGNLFKSVNYSYTTPNNIRLIFKEQSTGFIYWSSGYLNAIGDKIYIPDAPCNLPTVIEVWGGCPYYLLGSVIVNDLCTADPIEIELSNLQPPTGQLINVDLTVFANCEFARLRPNISAFYDDGCGWKYVGQVVNGQIIIPGLESGKGYSFGVWIDDNWFDDFFIVNQSSYTWNIDLPQSICSKY